MVRSKRFSSNVIRRYVYSTVLYFIARLETYLFYNITVPRISVQSFVLHLFIQLFNRRLLNYQFKKYLQRILKKRQSSLRHFDVTSTTTFQDSLKPISVSSAFETTPSNTSIFCIRQNNVIPTPPISTYILTYIYLH